MAAGAELRDRQALVAIGCVRWILHLGKNEKRVKTNQREKDVLSLPEGLRATFQLQFRSKYYHEEQNKVDLPSSYLKCLLPHSAVSQLKVISISGCSAAS